MATNPFDFWSRALRTGASLTQTGLRLVETMRASSAVVERRSQNIATASRDPFGADYAELGRMMPEKVAAFSRAGLSIFGDARAIQSNALANMHQAMTIALNGRMPTAAELDVMQRRSQRMIERAALAGGKALAPIHRTATGNARRLAAKRKSAGR